MKFWQPITWAETDQLIEIARFAEEVGFYGVMSGDHALYPGTMEAGYPYSDSGYPPQTEESEYPDQWALFGALAAATSRLHFTCGVYVLPLRNPIEVAKACATLDILSKGRFALGAGAGMVRAHVGRRLPEPDAPGYPSGGTLHPRLVTWLPDEELRAIAHSAAASDAVACAVCLERQTAISLQPCGHACLCGACALQIRRRAAGSTPPLCPVCRNPATGCHRVFLS